MPELDRDKLLETLRQAAANGQVDIGLVFPSHREMWLDGYGRACRILAAAISDGEFDRRESP